MASLMPEAIDLREVAKDVELLADQLARCESPDTLAERCHSS